MSIEKRLALDTEGLKFRRELATGYRSAVTRSRRLEGSVDLSQLPESKAASVGTSSGGHRFSLGYSRLGGNHKLG